MRDTDEALPSHIPETLQNLTGFDIFVYLGCIKNTRFILKVYHFY